MKQYLAIRLPAGTELWSAFVAGEPVKPMKAEDGTFRIPLAKSQAGNAGQQGFPVELITYRPTSKFMPIGYKALTLPMPDAPVSRMLWSVYLPEKYRFPYFGGDVEKGIMAQPWNALRGTAAMDRSEVADLNNPVPLNEKEGMKKDLRNVASKLMTYGTDEGKAKEAVVRQAELASGLFQNGGILPTATGVFPVAFELPASGQLFHFGQIMVVGQDPQLTIAYLHLRLVYLIVILFLAWPMRLLYRRRSAIADFLLHLEVIQAIRGRMKLATQSH